ncbi:MAG: carboxypeptidase-like regulatory domain-containing protein [bacterium]|nr:carboxypeptidase-like regulatory domain-containing protein [bacterium]
MACKWWQYGFDFTTQQLIATNSETGSLNLLTKFVPNAVLLLHPRFQLVLGCSVNLSIFDNTSVTYRTNFNSYPPSYFYKENSGNYNLKSQSISIQKIRGIVLVKVPQVPLPRAIIAITSMLPNIGTATNSSGEFYLSKIPIGKISIKITYIRYKTKFIENISLNAGKELFLNSALEEEISQINEVIIKDEKSKNTPLNSMSLISTRTFSVEETQKFVAAVNDLGRMATSFAGVVVAGDGNNHINIRGNSPNGLLWRMEGVDIPNPNHFSNVGTSGGGISILSAQLLTNSDFWTGAFASEYGNALSGVFDLRLRRGNNKKTEYTFQAGLLGLDAAMEGPIKRV